jgi:hypothetical protein
MWKNWSLPHFAIKNWEALLCTTFPHTKLIHIYILPLDFLPISRFQVLPVKQEIWIGSIFTRPGVAGAVLQTALSFINSLGNSSLVEISSEQLQTVQARDLKFWHNDRLPLYVMCHLSWFSVTCHDSVSRVMCHGSVSRVMIQCHVSCVTIQCHMSQKKKWWS